MLGRIWGNGLIVVLASCSFPGAPGSAAEDTADAKVNPGRDASVDGQAPRCKFTYGDFCALAPAAALTYSASTIIDTSIDAACTGRVSQGASRPELCVIYAASITIAAGATVRGIGTRPLVLASTSSISVLGRIEVSSNRAQLAPSPAPEVLGAGAQLAACTFARAPESDTGGGAGAAGASFGGKGGDGGTGDSNNSSGGDDVALPGLAAPADTLSFVRGGCRGQVGGSYGANANGEPPGAGGPPGGAVYLAAATEIVLAASGGVSANGGGGLGGGSQSGGSGGGSGGAIILEATNLRIAGLMTANGGGGGEGGVYFVNTNTRVTGAPGSDGSFNTARALGGNSTTTNVSGQGGDGSAAAARDGSNGTFSPEGGAGGGGGAGFIRLLGTVDGSGVLSPPAS